MSFRPIHDEEKRRIRFLFDGEQGVIRHKSRGGKEQDYRIEVGADGCFDLKPVDCLVSEQVLPFLRGQ